MFQFSCLILYLKRNRNQRVHMAWALRPGSRWSSNSVVPTCPPRWSLLHTEASLLLTASWTWWHELQPGSLASLSHHLPSWAGPGASQTCSVCLSVCLSECLSCCHPRFPFFWFLLILHFLREALPMIPTLGEHHPVVHDFSSPFSSSCSQNFKFIFHLWVCLSNGFLFYNTVSRIREHGWLVCVHSIGF